MEFRVLGDLEVLEDGQALVLGPHQQRAVLALLVLSAGEVVSSDRLIEALWGERPPASAAWVSDAGNNVVSRISDRNVVDRIPTGDGPGAIAVGDGAVWVAERFDDKVARIDPSVDRVTAEIPVGAAPSALAVIGHSVWVANSGDGTLSEIDARARAERFPRAPPTNTCPPVCPASATSRSTRSAATSPGHGA